MAENRRASPTTALRVALGVLTPFGRGLLVTAFGCLVLGTRLNWQEFTQFGVVGLVLVGLALGWVLVPGAPRAEVKLPTTRTSDGRHVEAELRVRNGALPLLHPVIHVPVAGTPGVALRLPLLRPMTSHRETVPLPLRPRGVWVVGPVSYEKSDVLGVARRTVETSGMVQLWVRPRVIPLELMSSGATTDLEGATSEQLTMSDLAFHALREYRPGDDLRHVHWRSSAKADRLLVRQYHETRRGHLTVLVDHQPSSFARSDDFELAVSVASSVALRAVSDGLETYIQCGSVAVAARGAEQVLDAACRFHRHPGEYAGPAMAAARANPGTGLVVQVTGPGRQAGALRAAAPHFNPEAQHVIIRADTAGGTAVAEFHRSREITLSSLEQLPGLLVGSLR